MNTLVLCVILSLPWNIASYAIVFAKQSMGYVRFWGPRQAEGRQENYQQSNPIMSAYTETNASAVRLERFPSYDSKVSERLSLVGSVKQPPGEMSRDLPPSSSAFAAGSKVESTRPGAPVRSILKHARKLHKPARPKSTQLTCPEAIPVYATPALSPSTVPAVCAQLPPSELHSPKLSSRNSSWSFTKLKKSRSCPSSKSGRVTQHRPSVTTHSATKPAIAPKNSQSLHNIFAATPPEIASTSLVPHAIPSHTPKLEVMSEPPQEDDLIPSSIEEWFRANQIRYDQELAERLQALDNGDPDPECESRPSKIPKRDEQHKTILENSTSRYNHATQPTDIDHPMLDAPALSKDYRATAEDINRVFSGPERAKRFTVPPPSKDYRAKQEDLQKILKASQDLRNNGSGSSFSGQLSDQQLHHSPQAIQQNEEKVGFAQTREHRQKRHAIHGVDHFLPRTSPKPREPLDDTFREPSKNTLREPRGPPLQGYANARYGSTKPTGLGFGTGLSYIKSFFTSPAQGTRNNPIDLSADTDTEDENEDVEMFHDAVDDHGIPILTHDCAVCGESAPMADMPSLQNCAHKAETCSSCFARWIESELTAKGWKGICCPHSDCAVLLAYHEVQLHATPEVFARYESFSVRETLGGVPNFTWCLNHRCQSGQVHHEDGNIFKCIACGHKSCVVHNVAWHEGETCDEYNYRTSGAKEREQKAQEEASIAMINRSSKKCPGPNCAFNIQKNNGCDHMTCKIPLMVKSPMLIWMLRLAMSIRILLGVLGRLPEDTEQGQHGARAGLQIPYQ